jgi:hypothetical protein
LEILESQLGRANVARQVLKEVQSVFPKKELTEEDEKEAVDPESKTGGGKNRLLPSASEIEIHPCRQQSGTVVNTLAATPENISI